MEAAELSEQIRKTAKKDKQAQLLQEIEDAVSEKKRWETLRYMKSDT